MDDGLDEALPGLEEFGLGVLNVAEGPEERWSRSSPSAGGRLLALRRGGRGPGSDVDRHPGSQCFGRPGATAVDQAPVALCRRGLRGADPGPTIPINAQAVLTRRACAEASGQVGEEARLVSRLAAELGVCWWTVMNARHRRHRPGRPARQGAHQRGRGQHGR